MKCKECIDILNEYADGELAPEIRQQVTEHLDSCLECKEYYSFIKDIKLTDDDIDFPEELHENIMSYVRQDKVRKMPLYRRKVFGWAAAACIVLAAAAVVAPRLSNPAMKESEYKSSGYMFDADPSIDNAVFDVPQAPGMPQDGKEAMNPCDPSATENKNDAMHGFKGSLELSGKLSSFNYTESDGELYFECNDEDEVKLLEKLLLESGYEVTEDISQNGRDMLASHNNIVVVVKK